MMLVRTYLDRSPLHGFGVFTKDAIPAQTLAWEFTEGLDLEISAAQFAAQPLVIREYILHYGNQTEEDLYLLCGDHARFMNHSDRPNLSASTYEGFALRHIAAGEEITCDYREFDINFKGF